MCRVKKNCNNILSRFHRTQRTDGIAISITRVSVLTRDKKTILTKPSSWPRSVNMSQLTNDQATSISTVKSSVMFISIERRHTAKMKPKKTQTNPQRMIDTIGKM